MHRPVSYREARIALLGFAIAVSWGGTAAQAQVPNQEPFAPAVPGEASVPTIPESLAVPVAVPAAPDPAAPPAAEPAKAMTQAELEAKVRQLESLINQMQKTKPGGAGDQPASGAAGAGAAGRAGSGASSTAGGTTAPRGTASADTGSAASNAAPSSSGGTSAPGQSLPPNPSASKRFNSPATLDSVKANVKFGPGFEIRTEDDEYILQFHNLTQLDYRGYGQAGQTNVRDSFLFPRQWFMFSGRISKPFGYFVSFAEGFDTLNILDVFVDSDVDPRLRIRAGRFKTPFTYEFLVEPIQGLVVPERSIFFNNFAQNRDVGVMAYGRMFQNKFDYAAGIFNGTRNGLVALQNEKAFSGFVNYKPFGEEENTLFENLNIGGSIFATEHQQSPVPQTLRTVVPTAGNSVAGIPFLNFNNNVRESGPLAFWDAHVAWFYQSWAFIAEYAGGFQDYALAGNLQSKTHLPIQSFYIQASYLITGETRSSFGIVKPLDPVSFGRGKGFSGTGAIEPFFRYEYLDIGSQVFSNGLADGNLWTNRVNATHVGVNWHLTQYVKMYFDWNHDDFNNPVLFAPGRHQKTSDLFLLRLQLYF